MSRRGKQGPGRSRLRRATSKFLRLSATDRRLLVGTLFLVAIVRLGLTVIPFRIIRRFVDRITELPKTTTAAAQPAISQSSINRIKWAVEATSRYIPDATCLTRALTVQILLARRGQPCDIRIGVAKDEKGQFKAHAWVESQGQVIIGGEGAGGADVSSWTALPVFDRKSA